MRVKVDMKIWVSPKIFSAEMFPDAPEYQAPMEELGMCEVDESLALGEMIIEFDDGQRVLLRQGEEDTKIEILPRAG